MQTLIEPLGLLTGRDAQDALASRLALPLQGGDTAFSLVRLIGAGADRIVAVTAVPPEWQACLRLVSAPPPLAGLPAGPLVMGILNVTPDSFSDGGRHLAVGDAIRAGMAMLEAGADLIDVGGESTRPGAASVAPAAEQARILPVVEALARHGVISVDTRNAATMRAALAAGATVVNDVSALAHDPAAAATLADQRCTVALMHMRGTPATMTGLASYGDVAVEVVRELRHHRDAAIAAGIARDRILVDPGLGFAKDAAQNLALLRRLPLLACLGQRVLLGASRKRFIAQLEGQVAGARDAASRDPGSIAASLSGLALNGCILRVHDVAGMVQALRLWQAIRH
ncbi:dihydropteroate synthase [Lichenicoccus sp.]|uniref:dihydropteroate synthase n=1 Tax=Lichenicoccus sp. TaxID=2781899 RepID=UPI003D0B7E72